MLDTRRAAFWEWLIGSRQTPPDPARTRRVRLFGVLTVIVALVCGTRHFSQLTDSSVSLADRLFSGALLGIAVICVVVGGWIALRVPWRLGADLEQRRGRILAIIVLVQLLLILLVMPTDPNVLQLNVNVLAFWLMLPVVFVQVRWLATNGQTRVGAGVLIGAFLLYLLSAASLTDWLTLTVLPYAQAIMILCAGLLISPWAGLLIAALVPISGALIGRLVIPDLALDPVNIGLRTTFLLVVAAIVALYARSLERALLLADQQAADLQRAQDSLTAQNTRLREQQIALEESRTALAETIAHQDELIAVKMAELRDRSIEILTIQTPLIRVAAGVLVAPLAGSWNAERAEKFLVALLDTLEARGVNTVVLDLTGALMASADLVELIRQVITAAPLLGCTCVIAGVAPELAQELVHLQVNLHNVHAVADLADALRLT